MDEDISIINKNTRNENIKNFFINNKKTLISTLIVLILILFGYFAYKEIQSKQKIELAEKYNQISNKYISNKNENIIDDLVQIINEKDSTYSPLALYFIIDNELEASNEEINKYFDILINDTRLEKEIKNLIIYKKGLFNSDFETENNLISILRPIINSESVWKSQALYLMAEFFMYKNQKQKAKEFYNQILNDKNSNENLRKEARKRLSRDFSE